MSTLQALSDWALAAVSALVAGVGGYARTVDSRSKRNEARSKRNQRQLQGDPDDPNAEGVLSIAKQTRDDLQAFRRETQQAHEELRDIVESLDTNHE